MVVCVKAAVVASKLDLRRKRQARFAALRLYVPSDAIGAKNVAIRRENRQGRRQAQGVSTSSLKPHSLRSGRSAAAACAGASR